MRRRPRLLIAKAGVAAEAVTRDHGDYDRWFIDAMGSPERFTVVDIFRGQPLPDPKPFDGVIVTGSPLSVCDAEPWMAAAGVTLREWADSGRAVLGVCFGHQLMAEAFGSKVVKNPGGREIGTITVQLTPEGERDVLFEGLAAEMKLQATHTDIARAVPPGTVQLAGNANTMVQALRFGRRARGVQFHPELGASALRTLIRSRTEILAREGIDGDERERLVKETPAGVTILRNFEERLAGE